MTKYLITSALPYINGTKHLGNLVGSMLPADVYARYLRAKNFEVLYICATDEHGTPAELAAAKANCTVQEFCDKQYEIQHNLCKDFDLSFDYFGRTSSRCNHELTQHFAQKLLEQGYLEARTIEQIYSVDEKRFLADRYVVGTCPYCQYDKAQGDQCESCTKILDPTDLINPRSSISGSTNLEMRTSTHLFLLQSKLVPEIKLWLNQQKNWPKSVIAIANKWLTEGIRDRCITRDLDWGVKVNQPGFVNKVFYVWFDAPIGYISATKEWGELTGKDWQSYWYDTQDVKYIQFMAKDNVPFHTISFPATILGTKEPWKLPDFIKGFNWLTYYGGKFSTSQGRGVFMDKALELYPADYWRYYLIKNAPEKDDTDFTWPLFAETVNKDLADNLGNFCQRIITIIERNFDFIVPHTMPLTDFELQLITSIDLEFEYYQSFMMELQFGKATRALREIWKKGNEYINSMAPWKLLKTDMNAAGGVLNIAISLLRFYAIISEPIIPQSYSKILKALNLTKHDSCWPRSLNDDINFFKGGEIISSPGILFKKISQDESKSHELHFGSYT